MSDGRDTKSSVWDSMMLRKIWGSPSTPLLYHIWLQLIWYENVGIRYADVNRWWYLQRFSLSWYYNIEVLRKATTSTTVLQFDTAFIQVLFKLSIYIGILDNEKLLHSRSVSLLFLPLIPDSRSMKSHDLMYPNSELHINVSINHSCC